MVQNGSRRTRKLSHSRLIEANVHSHGDLIEARTGPATPSHEESHVEMDRFSKAIARVNQSEELSSNDEDDAYAVPRRSSTRGANPPATTQHMQKKQSSRKARQLRPVAAHSLAEASEATSSAGICTCRRLCLLVCVITFANITILPAMDQAMVGSLDQEAAADTPAPLQLWAASVSSQDLPEESSTAGATATGHDDVHSQLSGQTSGKGSSTSASHGSAHKKHTRTPTAATAKAPTAEITSSDALLSTMMREAASPEPPPPRHLPPSPRPSRPPRPCGRLCQMVKSSPPPSAAPALDISATLSPPPAPISRPRPPLRVPSPAEEISDVPDALPPKPRPRPPIILPASSPPSASPPPPSNPPLVEAAAVIASRVVYSWVAHKRTNCWWGGNGAELDLEEPQGSPAPMLKSLVACKDDCMHKYPTCSGVLFSDSKLQCYRRGQVTFRKCHPDGDLDLYELKLPPPPAPPLPPPPPPLHPMTAVERTVFKLNQQFLSGRPSNDLEEAGILIHQFDSLDDPNPDGAPWLPQRPTISVAIVNGAQQPEPDRGNVPVYSYSLAGVILDPASNAVKCSYAYDVGSLMFNGGCNGNRCNSAESIDGHGNSGCAFNPPDLKQMMKVRLVYCDIHRWSELSGETCMCNAHTLPLPWHALNRIAYALRHHSHHVPNAQPLHTRAHTSHPTTYHSNPQGHHI